MVLTLVRFEPISCYKLHNWISSLHLQQPTCRTIKTLATLNHIYLSHTIWLVGLYHRIGSCCNNRFWNHCNFLHSSRSWVVGRSYKLPCMSNVNGEPIKKNWWHDEHNHEGKEHTHLFLIFQILLSPNEEGTCIRCAPRVVRIWACTHWQWSFLIQKGDSI
jgi:hypothetical protein